jgi:ABC-type multidrug transport system fused ATPase/permease subunit
VDAGVGGTSNVDFWLRLYAATVLATAIATFARVLLGITASYYSSKTLFLDCLFRVINAPTRYHDTVPSGRILNRLVSDIAVADSFFRGTLRSFVDTGLAFLSSFAVISWVVPSFVPVALSLLFGYWQIALPYRRTASELRRLENIYRSPLFTVIGESIAGLGTIRAFATTSNYASLMFQSTDSFQQYDHYYWNASQW